MFESATFSPSLDQCRSLYIHIPFCRHRCDYCNFALLANRDDLIDRYLELLAVEIGWLQNKPRVSTVFLGGGTPSLLNRNQLRVLIELIHQRFEIAATGEVTIECNPNDVTQDFCTTLKQLGFNRISLGVQSFSDDKLKRLDRDHSQNQVTTAISILKQHFDNVSLDLIFAAPGEQSNAWRDDMDAAIDMQPQHLSTYELTIEKGTAFWNRQYHGTLKVPGEDLKAELYEDTIAKLNRAGYRQYEISSFAKQGFECQHNQTYWNGSEYLAFGTSAARFVDGVRETNHRSTSKYMQRVANGQSPVYEQDKMSAANLILERIAFGLRQISGIDSAVVELAFETLPNCLAHELEAVLKRFSSIGVLEDSAGFYRLTLRGVLLYDSIANQILAIAD